ncbi:MAG: hypothetical protein RRA35_08175 [Desulfomonilia bacterium]|nr:hypothetical protein [Desulfomonilia bacterium]
MIWTVMMQRMKEVLVRRTTVKKAILNLRLADRYLCDNNRRAALNNFKSACTYEAMVRAHDRRFEGVSTRSSHHRSSLFTMKFVLIIGEIKRNHDISPMESETLLT